MSAIPKGPTFSEVTFILEGGKRKIMINARLFIHLQKKIRRNDVCQRKKFFRNVFLNYQQRFLHSIICEQPDKDIKPIFTRIIISYIIIR